MVWTNYSLCKITRLKPEKHGNISFPSNQSKILRDYDLFEPKLNQKTEEKGEREVLLEEGEHDRWRESTIRGGRARPNSSSLWFERLSQLAMKVPTDNGRVLSVLLGRSSPQRKILLFGSLGKGWMKGGTYVGGYIWFSLDRRKKKIARGKEGRSGEKLTERKY